MRRAYPRPARRSKRKARAAGAAPAASGSCARTHGRPRRKPRSQSPRRSWKSSAMLVSARPSRCFRSGNVPAGLSTSCTTALWKSSPRPRRTPPEALRSRRRSAAPLLPRRAGRREHERDRLADVAHLLDREDRLVVEGGPVVRVGDDAGGCLLPVMTDARREPPAPRCDVDAGGCARARRCCGRSCRAACPAVAGCARTPRGRSASHALPHAVASVRSANAMWRSSGS